MAHSEPTQPVRVLYFITELNIGGAEKVLVHLISNLDQTRFTPMVACLYDGNTPIADEIRLLGIPVYDLEMKTKWQIKALWQFYALLREWKPTILHSSLFHANLVGRLVGRLAGVPIIISCRQNISIGGRLREALNRMTVWLDDRVIAVCELARQAELKATKLPPEKVVTIYNAVDIDHLMQNKQPVQESIRTSYNIAAEAILIGTACRFHPQKGVHNLISAFAKVQEGYPQTHLVLVGDGELREELELQVERLALSQSVTFTGLRTDIPNVLSELTLFVLPSLWEGLPMVLLEAMAIGCPVVATNVGGTPEIVLSGQTGILVEPDNPHALTGAITRLLMDVELRNRQVHRASRRVEEHFSAAQSAAKTMQIYESLME